MEAKVNLEDMNCRFSHTLKDVIIIIITTTTTTTMTRSKINMEFRLSTNNMIDDDDDVSVLLTTVHR